MKATAAQTVPCHSSALDSRVWPGTTTLPNYQSQLQGRLLKSQSAPSPQLPALLTQDLNECLGPGPNPPPITGNTSLGDYGTTDHAEGIEGRAEGSRRKWPPCSLRFRK